MSLLSRLGLKNKNSEHYQKNYEEREKEVKIESGATGLGEEVFGNKKEYYEQVRERITGSDIRKIKRMGKASNGINDVFRKMESEGMPLDYLVALGLAEEIDIESYHNVKMKGLEEVEEQELEIDEDVKGMVFGYEEDVPEIKVNVEDEEDGEEGEEEDISEEDEEEDENRYKLQSLIEKFEKSKKKAKRTDTEKRKVFVVAKDLEIPDLENYEVVKVEDVGQITSFTTNKRDVLVVTNDIPKDLQKPFLKWFKGIESADRKYRVVTLKGSEIKHELIEDVIFLTDDSIDGYFNRYEDDLYTGEDVKGFHDIEDFLRG